MNQATNMVEERDQNPLPPQPQQQLRALRDYFQPVVNDNYLGIYWQAINANDFELKLVLINMIHQDQYGCLSHEDLNIHLAMFFEVCDTVKMNEVDQGLIRIRLFPFSLRDKARGWLQSLQLGSISIWEELAQKFYPKFFPPLKSSQLKGEIAQFRQLDFKSLYES
ncbi:hypothetical protein OWV82_006714 [Melia azedarach]|uniref:Uncharacterized protein n=1 Tax=Melia azedarach TaxID=155640 RepID=A0ACC1YL40_MELAZ|nr:hypothetical protein OWV82_006714 [Melia azedarach]